MGLAVGDNYTPEVVDAVATSIWRIAAMYDASAVLLVGHSGGAAIAANVLGRHPDTAGMRRCWSRADAIRKPGGARMHAQQPDPIWDGPTSSLMPLSLVNGVAPEARVRLLVGEADDVALPQDSRRYAEALQARGIDAGVSTSCQGSGTISS